MPLDPAAVAAEKEAKERNDFYMLVGGIAVAVMGGAFVTIKFVQEASEAAAAARRPKQPWDV